MKDVQQFESCMGRVGLEFHQLERIMDRLRHAMALFSEEGDFPLEELDDQPLYEFLRSNFLALGDRGHYLAEWLYDKIAPAEDDDEMRTIHVTCSRCGKQRVVPVYQGEEEPDAATFVCISCDPEG